MISDGKTFKMLLAENAAQSENLVFIAFYYQVNGIINWAWSNILMIELIVNVHLQPEKIILSQIQRQQIAIWNYASWNISINRYKKYEMYL